MNGREAVMAITQEISELLQNEGVSLYGFADLRDLPEEQRDGFDYGISIALALDKDVLLGIGEGPTLAYYENYESLNLRLDALDLLIERTLTGHGFKAQGNTRDLVGSGEGDAGNNTKLPHKTVATHAGLGWIGKCALLITEQFGSGVRISSILTDAPLETATPVTTSRCGPCLICQDICPANAVSGKNWYAGLPREEFWDAAACRKTAYERSQKGFGNGEASICGLCILKCPWTQKALMP
jgi:epoxyqueuosine reductase QueG